MTKEELATKLNGREYGFEITPSEGKEAKDNGLVVVFGASDDLMEFRGAIYDELGGDDTAYLTESGLLNNDCGNAGCPYFAELIKSCPDRISGIWDEDGISWRYETDMPHATFDVMEDGEIYCRGIVIELPKKEGQR